AAAGGDSFRLGDAARARRDRLRSSPGLGDRGPPGPSRHFDGEAARSLGPWGPASRWWRGAEAEWDLVSESLDGRRVLLGEVKWSARPFDRKSLEAAFRDLAARPAPPLPPRSSSAEIVRALFVPAASKGGTVRVPDGPVLVRAMDLLER
ncbi:MAG TPA: hypothetical protein VII86_01210, partial [Thermoanaerobaculia bacterium]